MHHTDNIRRTAKLPLPRRRRRRRSLWLATRCGCRAGEAPLRRRTVTSNSQLSLRRPPTELLRNGSLFLDFDGTIVEIVDRPDGVQVSAKLRSLLERLRERLDGRLVIVTGRVTAEIEGMLHPLVLAVRGSHGLEAAGDFASGAPARKEGLDDLVEELRKLANEFPGIIVEDKPLGVALHYRQAPQAEEVCRAAIEKAADRLGLEIQLGKMVFELKPSGNKGDALRQMMQQQPFAATTPVFLGDDLTDEPAFVAAQDLGGGGILVGDKLPTAARYQLQSVSDAVEWLESACAAA